MIETNDERKLEKSVLVAQHHDDKLFVLDRKTLNHIIVYKIFVLDRNTLNHIIVYKIFVLECL